MGQFDKQIETNKSDRYKLVVDQRSLVSKAEGEKRALTAEERVEFDRMDKAIGDHETRLADLEKLNKDETPPPEPKGDEGASDRNARPAALEERHKGKAHATAEYRAAFENWLKTGEKSPVLENRELRDLIVGTNTAGGFLVAPVQMSDDVIKQATDICFVRQLARYYPVKNAQALGVRKRTARASDADWTTEVAPVTKDTSLAFGRRDLVPHLCTKLVLASIQLLASGVDVEPIITEEHAELFGRTEEKGYLVGDGINKPLGIFTASDDGIPTSQDITSSVLADFNADDTIRMKYGIRSAYLQGPAVRWVMSRPYAAKVRMLKDLEGRYQWQAGLAIDQPDRLLDIPMAISEYAPTAVAAGAYGMALGNFKFYAIAEIATMFIQRLVERYAEINEVGYIGRRFIDGAPVQGEAFVRLKLKAA